MTSKRNPPGKEKIPDVCAAIHRVRQTTQTTQKQFAAMLGTVTMSLSRWERGVATPRDRNVLMRLSATAASAGMKQEEELFNQALGVLPPRAATPTQVWGGPISYLMLDFDTPQQWRLMIAAKLAMLYFPDTAARMEQAATDVMMLIDEVVSAAPENLRPDIYVRMEERLRELARQRAFTGLKKGTPQ
jgi:transcriptional regulator with XRE-family HTH domain